MCLTHRIHHLSLHPSLRQNRECGSIHTCSWRSMPINRFCSFCPSCGRAGARAGECKTQNLICVIAAMRRWGGASARAPIPRYPNLRPRWIHSLVAVLSNRQERDGAAARHINGAELSIVAAWLHHLGAGVRWGFGQNLDKCPNFVQTLSKLCPWFVQSPSMSKLCPNFVHTLSIKLSFVQCLSSLCLRNI